MDGRKVYTTTFDIERGSAGAGGGMTAERTVNRPSATGASATIVTSRIGEMEHDGRRCFAVSLDFDVENCKGRTIKTYAIVKDGEVFVQGMHISPYEQGNIFNKDPRRPRRLLAHKAEIRRLSQQIKLQGYTLVPLSLYFKKGRVKLELGLCKGKKLYDKRQDAANKDARRQIDRAMKERNR